MKYVCKIFLRVTSQYSDHLMTESQGSISQQLYKAY